MRLELTQVGDRELVPAGGRVGDGARTPRHQQIRILGEHRGELANRDLRFDTRRGHPAIQPRQELHAVLGIAQRTTLRRHGCTPAHVAERPQPLGRLGIDGRRRRGSGSTERSVERLPHLFDARRLLDRAIAGFGRIALELVQLGTRRVDELCRRRAPGMERRPPELQLRIERLGVRRGVAHRVPVGRRAKRSAVEVGTRGSPA